MRRLISLLLLVPAAVSAAPHFVMPSAPVLSGDPLRIELVGLRPRGRVTITAVAAGAGGKPVASHAEFMADARGVVDLAHATPLPGSSYAVRRPGRTLVVDDAGHGDGRSRRRP